MPKKRVTLAALTATAADVADADGFDALALTEVAKRLDVAASTLYTHTDGLDGLKHLVAVAAIHNLTDAVRQAAIGQSGREALIEMAVAYRQFALDHPGQFASTLLPPELDDQEVIAANAELRAIFVIVYQGIGFGEVEARRAAQATRGAIHGFLALERTTDPASEHDTDYLYLLNALQHGLLREHADETDT